MGQAAHSEGFVHFDTTANAEKAFKLFRDWAAKQNERDDADFCIENLNTVGEGVMYVVSSAKIANCEWQCEEIRDWFKKQPGCQRITQDIITCEGSVGWDVNDKEE